MIRRGRSKPATLARSFTLSGSSSKKNNPVYPLFHAFSVISTPIPEGSPGVITVSYTHLTLPTKA